MGPAITKAKMGTKMLREKGRLPRGHLLLVDDDFDDHETIFQAYNAFFRHVDTNGDGQIDAEELVNALKVLRLEGTCLHFFTFFFFIFRFLFSF